MNSQHIGIIVAIIALLAIGGFFFLSDSPQEIVTNPMSENANTGTENTNGNEGAETDSDGDGATNGTGEPAAVVTYTDEGYSPETVTIEEGQTVRFVNESSHGMWTASDIHPTHSLYPVSNDSDCLGSSFDACEAIAAGESWDYTFSEAGEWGYHNHRRANMTGTVIVE